MNYLKEIDRLADWIRSYVESSGAIGTVIGISGGIDSAVVAGLCKRAFPEHCLGLIMPCYSNPEDSKLAENVALNFRISVKKVVLDSAFDQIIEALGAVDDRSMALANLKPRLRMISLYYFAAVSNYLVAGTSNKSELFVGYFTKYGDGGVDFEPIGHLLKSEVREIAKLLGVPTSVIERPPTAGLWEGQTDEDEMGITYEDLDRYILTGEGSIQATAVAGRLMRKSEHKRSMPPIPR